MIRKLPILLSLIIGLGCLGLYEEAFSSSRKSGRSAALEEGESEEEGDVRVSSRGGGGGGEGSATGTVTEGGSSGKAAPGAGASSGHAPRKRVKASAAAPAVVLESKEIWTNQFNFKLNGIEINTIRENGHTLEQYTELRARQLREFYDFYDTTTHLASISVIYTTGVPGAQVGHRHDFPYFFVSGWFVNTLRSLIRGQPVAAVPEVARAILEKEHFSLGDCYEGLSTEAMRKAARLLVSNGAIENLVVDFEKRGWKGLQADNLNSSTEKITHSEHAFVSSVLRNKLSIPDVEPTAIAIVINGRLHPCDTCEPMLRFLIENRGFANEFIAHLFPATLGQDVSSVPLNIIYIASGKKITTPDLDMHTDEPYFVHGRR